MATDLGFFNQFREQYFPDVFATQLLIQNYVASLISSCANIDYQGQIKGMGDTIHFRGSPEITIKDDLNSTEGHIFEGTSADYDIVQHRIKYNRLKSTSKTMKIEKFVEWAFGLSDFTEHFSDLKSFAAAAVDIVSKRVNEAQSRRFLSSMFGDSVTFNPENCNAGAQAGFKSNAYNLGTATNPIKVNQDNATGFISDCYSVLAEQGVLSDGNNKGNETPFMVIPHLLKNIANKGDLKAAHITGASTGGIVLGQQAIGNLGGFNLLETMHLSATPTTIAAKQYNVFPIYFGLKQATTFATKVDDTKCVEFTDQWGTGMAGMTIYDFKTLYPDRVGLAYVTFESNTSSQVTPAAA